MIRVTVCKDCIGIKSGDDYSYYSLQDANIIHYELSKAIPELRENMRKERIEMLKKLQEELKLLEDYSGTT